MDYLPEDGSQQQAMLQEEQEWLEELARDEAARREFHEWLASTHTEGNSDGIDCHKTSEQF